MRSVLAGVLFAVPFYLLCGLGVAMFAAFKRSAAPPLRRWRYALLASLITTFLVGAPACANAVAYRMESRYSPRVVTDADRHPDNLTIVLTGGWLRRDGTTYDIKISEDGWERLDAGVKLWQRIGGMLLIAGAPVPDGSGRSIAGAMAEAARARGVPDAAIVVEGQSGDTHENLTFSMPLLEAHRDHLWLVTSALHLPRAMGVAAKLGLRPVPYPCFYRASRGSSLRDWLPSNHAPVTLEFALHEYAGIVWYRLRGWI